MRILLDESLPRHFAGHLHPHDVSTVQQCGWAGKQNGELLTVAELQFDLLLTADQSTTSFLVFACSYGSSCS